MQPIRLLPTVHLLVCANRREATSPLGPGCGDAGESVYAALKAGVARRGLVRSVWVTKTYCLGTCPKVGATVASYPRQRLWAGVKPGDATTLLEETVDGKERGIP